MVYYRIFRNRNDLLTIVCMQDFDEDDYYQNRFARDSQGNKLKFDSEEDALLFLNQNWNKEEIDEQYVTDIARPSSVNNLILDLSSKRNIPIAQAVKIVLNDLKLFCQNNNIII